MWSCCSCDPGPELCWISPTYSPLKSLHSVSLLFFTFAWRSQTESAFIVSTWRSFVKCRYNRKVLCPSGGALLWLQLCDVQYLQYICRLSYSLQMQFKLQAVCGGVCPAGSRGCHAPVIHMVIVRGPARAKPHISSPVPLSGSHCQPGEERREERRREGNAICLFACLLLFYLVFFCWSQ